MSMFSLASEKFEPFAHWLSRDARMFLERDFYKISTNLQKCSPTEAVHRICLLSNLSSDLLLENIEGSLLQLLLVFSCEAPLEIQIFFTYLKRDHSYHLFDGERSVPQGVTSMKNFKKRLLKTFLHDSRNYFRERGRDSLLLNLLDPYHFTRVDLSDCLCACALSFVFKPAKVSGNGLPYFSRFQVDIDYLPNEDCEE